MTETPPGRPPQPPTAPGSPAPAHGDGPTRPDGPTGRTELRDRLREALTTERWGSEHALGEHGTGHSFYAPCGICQGDLAAIIRLVMPVVQAALAEVERQRDEALAAVADEQRRADERRTELLEERDEALDALADAERERDEALEALAYGAETLRRAEEAERLAAEYRMQVDDPDSLLHALDQARDAIADERRGRLVAEAAVRRALAVIDEALPDWEDTRAYHRERADRKGYSHDEAVAETSERAIKVMTDILAALDAEQPKETP